MLKNFSCFEVLFLNLVELISMWDFVYQVGFEMIDSISEAQGIPMNTIQSKALIGIGGSSAIMCFDF